MCQPHALDTFRKTVGVRDADAAPHQHVEANTTGAAGMQALKLSVAHLAIDRHDGAGFKRQGQESIKRAALSTP